MGDLLFSSLFLRRRFRLLLSKVSGKVKEEQIMLFGFLSHAGWRSSEFVEVPSSLRKSSVSTESKHQHISINDLFTKFFLPFLSCLFRPLHPTSSPLRRRRQKN